jgi:hypothetical protein
MGAVVSEEWLPSAVAMLVRPVEGAGAVIIFVGAVAGLVASACPPPGGAIKRATVAEELSLAVAAAGALVALVAIASATWWRWILLCIEGLGRTPSGAPRRATGEPGWHIAMRALAMCRGALVS